MLRIEGLSYSINGTRILHGITEVASLSDSPIVILGPSGSGKSTFLKCVSYLQKPTEGKIFLDNIELNDQYIRNIRHKIGFVFQDFGLFPHMNVMENVCYTPQKVYKQNCYSKAKELLAKMSIEHRSNSFPDSLSGGEKQKVAIIRSMILNPTILFFDEPTSALDEKSTESLIDIIKMMDNVLVIIVTHDKSFAKSVAKKVWEFRDGNIDSQYINHLNDYQVFNNDSLKKKKQMNESNKLIKSPEYKAFSDTICRPLIEIIKNVIISFIFLSTGFERNLIIIVLFFILAQFSMIIMENKISLLSKANKFVDVFIKLRHFFKNSKGALNAND
ncbi:ATP-binding cassette domain-containing protein [Candidatus Gromoviella agglomerans]|uniref:ATP-binding cassette domain-containing protein n=1 Tax=Candidatus Gromoviella agglomerans TaxID=2806609 RepID=UPI001E3F3C70|nr:ATP-binding cassette domain-containing protein [Candidatus Gromoviella agglomerans]UFX98192.1 Amino acid ABC transporter ATP-binding protein [Candidatus Gromoviella agglomerans]